MAGYYSTNIPKLKGRENYEEWAFETNNYLVLEGMLNWGKVEQRDAKLDTKAKAKLILTID